VPLEDDLRSYARALRDDAASALVADLRAVAPARSGALVSSIEDPEPTEDDGSVGAVVRVDADYAAQTDADGPHAGWFTDTLEAWPECLEDASGRVTRGDD
jgi:hypothetical protein